MAGDEVDELLDELWAAVRAGDVPDPDAVRALAGRSSERLGQARDRAREQLQAQVDLAASDGRRRRERKRAEVDAATYGSIAELCEQALGDSTPAEDDNGAGRPVVLAPPLLAVEVIAMIADQLWSKLIRFTTIPRADDRISVPPLTATVESVVWSLDANDVAVPTARCRVAGAHDPRTLRGHGWVQRAPSSDRS
jgi:hypothetical protein